MPGKHIRMAILDDGVHPEACPLKGSFLINDDLSVIDIGKYTVASDSHGSMCARIVQRYTGLDKVDVFSIQILQEDTLRGNIGRLLKALELCVSMNIRLIHLSVGTYAFEDFAKLEEAVQHLLNSDRFLVAAAGNRGTVTYPAYLPGVIGVKCCQELTGGEYLYCDDPFTRIHFQASSRHKLILDGKGRETPVSNSYAAPLVTAKLLSCIKEHRDLGKDEILRLFMEGTERRAYVKNSEPHPYPPVEIPVVLLSGFSANRMSHLMELLFGCLRREDYHVRAASNLPGSRPWEETVLFESTDLDCFSARMAWYFSCEIILLGLTSYIPPDRYRNISLWIYGDESDDWKTAKTKADGQVLQTAGLSDIEIYEFMIEMLT